MRVEKDLQGNNIGLVLSRRNLLALLSKLDGHPVDSKCTIIAPSEYGYFYVMAEEDQWHYYDHPGRKVKGPGEMHPDTEADVYG